jgi:hypothetical protein
MTRDALVAIAKVYSSGAPGSSVYSAPLRAFARRCCSSGILASHSSRTESSKLSSQKHIKALTMRTVLLGSERDFRDHGVGGIEGQDEMGKGDEPASSGFWTTLHS